MRATHVDRRWTVQLEKYQPSASSCHPSGHPTQIWWFAQVEAQLITQGIAAQKTKDKYGVAFLSPEFATQGRDIILRIPDALPYDTLTQQLIARTALPTKQTPATLPIHWPGGPETNADSLPDAAVVRRQGYRTLLKEMFLQGLPVNVHMVLASSGEGKTLNEIAQLAEKSSQPPHLQ